MPHLEPLFSRINSALAKRTWIALLLLVAFYTALQIPRILVVTNFNALVFPLQSIVISTKLLFDGVHIRPALATAVITPVNGSLIYPPGIYALSALLGNVRNIYIFLFLIQSVVPLLFYRLLSRLARPLPALLASLLGTYYFVNAGWWAPDFVIQPLMILAFILLDIDREPQENQLWRLIGSGILTGLIIVLKQNIGVFFGVSLGTWLLLLSLAPRPAIGNEKLLVYLLLIGYFVFGVYFFRKLPHWDEVIYYLFPYGLFWGFFATRFASAQLGLDIRAFFRRELIFVASALPLPVALFSYFAGTIGAERYFKALFTMGLNNVLLWDKGFPALIKNSLVLGGAAETYKTFLTAFMYLLPCIVALYAVTEVIKRARDLSSPDALALFRYAALPVMGIFMLFPLESTHIVSTKLFLFVLVGTYFFERFHPIGRNTLILVFSALLVPVMAYMLINFANLTRMPTTFGSPIMQRQIGVPIEAHIAEEIQKQVATVEKTAGDSAFSVADSTDGTLWMLNAFMPQQHPQYYLEMQPGLLDQETVDAALAEMRDRPFVIVNSAEYEQYSHGRGIDPYMGKIYADVARNFTPVGSYKAPEAKPSTMENILSFQILRRSSR